VPSLHSTPLPVRFEGPARQTSLTLPFRPFHDWQPPFFSRSIGFYDDAENVSGGGILLSRTTPHLD
jgi:hypothetical protein